MADVPRRVHFGLYQPPGARLLCVRRGRDRSAWSVCVFFLILLIRVWGFLLLFPTHPLACDCDGEHLPASPPLPRTFFVAVFEHIRGCETDPITVCPCLST